ncbi:hypothetical protein NONO_c22200 [Nocardia nova SH22a]|uniref:VWFA domain-containing protein n=1 Tax=Nocardia nova SH22a TaxID=1415166 RepID=W5TDG2_9NOCA|nr:VWA domain-containing protein [Nocardia nova]AHH17018.1 hypothetical protein NONO_c22200 [Nocardia nova SH22a]
MGTEEQSSGVPDGGGRDAAPSRFANSERPPIFPVCLVIDVSASMEGAPITSVNESLPGIRSAILDDPSVEEVARVALVTFSESAKIALPLSDLRRQTMPRFEVESSTNFAEGLRAAREAIETGIGGLGRGTRFYRPVVFFFSDGEHNAPEDWKPAWRRLVAREDKFGAEVVSFGMGRANKDAIRAVSTRYAYYASAPDPGTAVRAILQSIIGTIGTTSRSFASASGGTLLVPPTEGLVQLPEHVIE